MKAWLIQLMVVFTVVGGLLCLWTRPVQSETGDTSHQEPGATGELRTESGHAEAVENQGEPFQKSSLIVTLDYIIGPEDVLDISVWRNQDLSKEVQVRPDGRISLPLIGDVMAEGKTPEQLTEQISARLNEYMENPTVAIVVKQVNSYFVFVMGEVARPGKLPLKSKTSLLQLITIAGGFTPVAARNKISVFRFGPNGDQQKIKASYDAIVLRGDSDQNVILKPGDTIVVPSQTMVLIP